LFERRFAEPVATPDQVRGRRFPRMLSGVSSEGSRQENASTQRRQRKDLEHFRDSKKRKNDPAKGKAVRVQKAR
jgi:hypothetical protein